MTSRLHRLVTALCAVAMAATLAGCTGQDAVNQTAGTSNRFVAGDGETDVLAPAERPAAPQVTGDLLDGGSFDLADHRGDVVVFNVWGSWCAPCRAEAGGLEQVYEQTKASGVDFVGINIRDQKSAARAMERTYDISYPSIYDPAGRAVLAFTDLPPNTIPATVVVDRAGRIAALFRKPVLVDDLLPVVQRIAHEKSGSAR